VERLPNIAATGVGSLPHTDPVAAVRHVMRSYDLPFCPQLPRLDGDMIEEWVGVEPGRCGWSRDRDRREPYAWPPFLDAVTKMPPRHRIVKLQVTGPVTLSAAIADPEDPTPFLFAKDVGAWLAAQTESQVGALRERGIDCLLIVDEPGLYRAGAETSVIQAWEPLRTLGSAWGLHVCCQPPWALLEAARPDVLNIDVVNFPIHRSAGDAVTRMVQAGTTMAWGITPVDRSENASVAAARLFAVVDSVWADARPHTEERVTRALVTPSCGTGGQPISRESQAVRVLREARMTMDAAS
jgi:hypothetical protein